MATTTISTESARPSLVQTLENVYATLHSGGAYDAKKDVLAETQKSKRVMQELSMFTGLSEAELKKDREEKKLILETMVKLKIFNIEKVGKIMADYYADKEKLLKRMNQFFKNTKNKKTGGA